jgi:starch phosphorylase
VQQQPGPSEEVIAYFSMEIGIRPEMPTYAGGLGVLAGDTIRAAADLGVAMVAVTLLHRRGFLRQDLDSTGWQTESAVEWRVEDFLKEQPQRATVEIECRTVHVRAWRYDVIGEAALPVPVFFLDTDLPENAEQDRGFTHYLYGGDQRYRLCQEAVLGIGGARMLHALGYDDVARYHMNEGHAALLGLELLEQAAGRAGRRAVRRDDVEAVRNRCVFTTHTPVPAGHDQFPMELVTRVLGEHEAFAMREVFCCDGRLNMTHLALNLSRHVNGVAKRHAEVSRSMFAHYAIDAITNGVHPATWVSLSMAQVFDRHLPDWRKESFSLRHALSLPAQEVRQAHATAKEVLLAEVQRQTGTGMDLGVLTLGFARRATAYKRPDLLFHDIARLRKIAANVGALQVVYAGKAHPQDIEGKQLIQRIFRSRDQLQRDVKVAYLADYDMRLAKVLTAGVDVWLNTPQPPLEASGTSGMKAALNGVPSLSVLDGWWIEGCIEGVTGWAIGDDGRRTSERPPDEVERAQDARDLYDKLEQAVMPTFYREPDRFNQIMLHCISLNGSFFNTHRMLQQYVAKSYFG